MNYPSLKTLQSIPGCTLETAKRIRAVLQANTREDVCAMSDKADKYNRVCYNRPPFHLVKLYAIDQLLGTYGVESFCIPEDSYSNCQQPTFEVEYCNTGDTYALTVCRIKNQGRVTYRVSSWGDIAEGY